MRKVHALLVLASAATIGLAQSPLTTSFAGGNSGNAQGGIYFDLQVNTTITITQIDFNSDPVAVGIPVGSAGTMSVWLGPTTYLNNIANTSLWTIVASAPVTVQAVGTPTTGVLSTPFALGPGNYGVAMQSQGFNWEYTNGVTCTSTTVPGSCSNSLFSNAELTLRGGAAQNAFLTNPAFTPRVFNGSIHYTIGGTPIAVASQQKYGLGCYGRWTSYFEDHPNSVGFDLDNTTVEHIFAGSHYAQVQVGATAFTPPGAGAPAATFLSGDNSVLATAVLGAAALPFPILYPQAGLAGVANDLEITSEGYIIPLPTAGVPSGLTVDTTPTSAELLNGPERWAPHWKNMNPTAGGNVTVENLGGTALVVSYNGVNDNGATSTFQVVFHQGGNVEYRYGIMSHVGGGSFPVVMGLSQGGGALSRGNLDVSAAMPFPMHAVDNAPLDVSLDNRPILGSNPNWVVSGYSQGTTPTVLGARILSFTQFDPGLPLAPLGMPGCNQFVGLDSTSVFFTAGPTTTFPFINGGIPNLPAFNGVLVFGQVATFTSGYNGLGVIASNGLRLLLGTL